MTTPMELCIIQHQDELVCASDRSLPLGDSPLTHPEPVPNNEVRFAEVICILDWEQEPMLCFPHKAHCADLIPYTGMCGLILLPHICIFKVGCFWEFPL